MALVNVYKFHGFMYQSKIKKKQACMAKRRARVGLLAPVFGCGSEAQLTFPSGSSPVLDFSQAYSLVESSSRPPSRRFPPQGGFCTTDGVTL